MGVFDGLEPKDVLYYFEQICAIPHPSGHPGRIGDYCEAFAKAHKLRYLRDKAGNVVIFKDGNSAKAPVILQGHLDMVCVKDDGVQIDFLRDALPVYTDGRLIRSRGTSLGADDGIGAAMILAVLAADLPDLPPIEAVLTMDEETGMFGAAALDASVLRGKRMINLDTEYEDVIYVACAGGARVTITQTPETSAIDDACLCVSLTGFAGGHSGTEIGTGRLNAVRETVKLLREIPDCRLVSLCGGEVDNAIPNACTAVFCADADAWMRVRDKHKAQILQSEPNAVMTFAESPAESALTAKSTREVLDLICALPNGVQKWKTLWKRRSISAGAASARKGWSCITACAAVWTAPKKRWWNRCGKRQKLTARRLKRRAPIPPGSTARTPRCATRLCAPTKRHSAKRRRRSRSTRDWNAACSAAR